MAIKHGLKRDLAGEKKAIKDYGTRKSQAKDAGMHGMAAHMDEIQSDEKDHRQILSTILRGLKSAK